MILDVGQFQRHFLSSMDIFKDNFKDTKPSFPSPTTSLFFSTHLTNMDIKRQIKENKQIKYPKKKKNIYKNLLKSSNFHTIGSSMSPKYSSP